MKILLIWPKARTDPEWGGDLGAIGEPLALEYLAAGVKKQGREVRILDLRLHPDILDETLLEFRPDIIGITAFSMHVLAALANCKRAKELLENVVTVVGGHHATLLPEDFFEPQMDYVVVGEGVYPFNLLVEAVENGHEVPEIPGLYRRSEEGFTLDAPPRNSKSNPFLFLIAKSPCKTAHPILLTGCRPWPSCVQRWDAPTGALSVRFGE